MDEFRGSRKLNVSKFQITQAYHKLALKNEPLNLRFCSDIKGKRFNNSWFE